MSAQPEDENGQGSGQTAEGATGPAEPVTAAPAEGMEQGTPAMGEPVTEAAPEAAETGGTAEAAAAEELPAGVVHPAADIRKVVWMGMATVALVFGGLGTWAAVAPLAGAVIGSGQVKVDMNRKSVQHLEGGIIDEILVRDGDHVQAGQPLVVIRDARVDAMVEVLRGQLDAELAKAARLEAQRDGLEEIRFPEELLQRSHEPKVAEFMRTEIKYFETKRQAFLDEIALLEQQAQEARQEIRSLEAQIRANEKAAALLQEEIDANESLEQGQYVQRTHVLGLKRLLEDYHSRNAAAKADISQARQKISDMELRIVQVRDEYTRSAVEDLTGVHAVGVYARIFDLRQRLRPSIDAKQRQVIRSPITGTVVGLRVFTVGGVVGPGDTLMDIVPDDNPLIVEAKLRVDDVDDVHVGQLSDIRFSAFKRRTTPLVAGTVVYVSADRLNDPNTGDPYYLTHINVDLDSLRESGLHITPGMPAEVYIRTEERTALDYLLAPITQTLRRSMRES